MLPRIVTRWQHAVAENTALKPWGQDCTLPGYQIGGGVFHGRPFSPPGVLLGFFCKNNIPNVFGWIVPKSMESAMYFGGKRMSGESGSNWVAIGVTEP